MSYNVNLEHGTQVKGLSCHMVGMVSSDVMVTISLVMVVSVLFGDYHDCTDSWS